MDIRLKRWGNNIAIPIPQKIAENFGINDNSTIELIETKDALIINKKQKVSTLDELLTSIPEDFQYPDDIIDFVESQALGQEII